MSRRAFLIGVAALLVPQAAAGQSRAAAPRVGILAQDIQPGLLETFRDELQKLGYVKGKSAVLEGRNAEGKSDRRRPSRSSSCGSPTP